MANNNEVKSKCLGMNHSTASGRLIKDILFSFVIKNSPFCYRCNTEMSRDNFSVDHLIPWLHKENATQLFFDLNNITFSHISCNVAASRKPHKKYFTEEEKKERVRQLSRENKKKHYCPEKRSIKFQEKGY